MCIYLTHRVRHFWTGLFVVPLVNFGSVVTANATFAIGIPNHNLLQDGFIAILGFLRWAWMNFG